MLFFRTWLLLVSFLVCSGCGYIHFGRLPSERATSVGDLALADAYTNLNTEQKILREELALVRKEGDALRNALERRPPDPHSPDLLKRLNDAAREIASLRAAFLGLPTESKTTPAPTTRVENAPSPELEEKLAVSTRHHARLEEENQQLRREVETTRAENAVLTEKFKTATAQAEQAQIAVAQLNNELLTQKEARARAEQASAAVRAQLAAAVAPPAANAKTLTETRAAPATPAATLQIAKAPAADAANTEFRTNPEWIFGGTLPAAVQTPAPTPRASAAAAPKLPGRTHRVQAGDTLEKIAGKYYNAPDQWRALYSANHELLGGGRPLRPGMELQIPEL